MIGFDFEVYMYDWMVVFEDFLTNEVVYFVNDVDGLREFYEKNKDNLLIGYNNNGYDNFILKGILMGKDPYYLSNVIINKTNNIWRLADWNSIGLYSYDVSYNVGFTSLKENEAYLGISIDETPVPFDLDRPLTDDEIELVLGYCKRDVNATKLIFMETISTFETKLFLISNFGLDKSFLNKSDNAILDEVLGARRKYRGANDEFDGFDFTQLDLRIEKYKSLLDHFRKDISSDYKSIGYSMMIADVMHSFGIGGVHGAIDNFDYDGKLMLIDVEAYYPSMTIAYDWFSRAVPSDKKELYAYMKNERGKIKHTNKKLSDAYKLVLNTAYGSYKYKWCNLYDPRMANNITIGGQVMLVDLIEQIEPYIEKLVQSNTDGIIVIPKDEAKVIEAVKEWETRTLMKTEIEYGRRIVQKDVNNYVMEMDDDKVVAVGAYVRQYAPRGLRRTLAVVDKALVEYLIHDTPIEQYIAQNNDPLDYQIISKVGKTYDKVFFRNTDGDVVTNKVNRSFAGFDEGVLLKQKIGKNPERIANHPSKSFVYNGYVDELDMNRIDKQWYVDMVYNRLYQYKGIKR